MACCSSCEKGTGCEGGSCARPAGRIAPAMFAPAMFAPISHPAYARRLDDVGAATLWANPRGYVTRPAGALPGGLTQAEWDRLTNPEKLALIDREARTTADREKLIADSVRSGASDVLRLAELLIQRDITLAQGDATRTAELEKQRRTLETAKSLDSFQKPEGSTETTDPGDKLPTGTTSGTTTGTTSGTTTGTTSGTTTGTTSGTTPPATQQAAGMSTGTKVALGVVAVAALGGLAWWAMQRKPGRRTYSNPDPEPAYGYGYAYPNPSPPALEYWQDNREPPPGYAYAYPEREPRPLRQLGPPERDPRTGRYLGRGR